MLSESYRVLEQLRLPHGLYVASPSQDYKYVWIRDCVYMALPYLDKPSNLYEQTYYRLLDLFREYEWKLDILCKHKPQWEWEYLHARYSHDEVREIPEEWGHIQHDMIGAFLFGIGQGAARGKKMLRDKKDKEIVQKLVNYLCKVEYWHDPDNGMWEEWREVHTSSVGACVSGLKAVEKLVHVPEEAVQQGLRTLMQLFPRESADKPADLAQLSLVYPYRLFTGVLGEAIVANVEKRLLRERGVIRYEGDSYYSTLEKTHGRSNPLEFYYGTEAEWTFGLPWLALCHMELGHPEKAAEYVRRSEAAMDGPGKLPELYYSGTKVPNPNNPLGWSCAMYILAKEAMNGGTHALRGLA
ncbi:phosphorylase kinase alpha/beta subunit [Paenibacillus phyllosphaerae]|uniref:Phosphorylase kinase alpha/beta subunit n=1 Tax=Paenibacillus phyllosphaerae TaxID=274593 RepID=A0A7W5AYD1_9BACL|nr:glycoside hydrolase family 15 protein [Paenibacillus phyllosphaerae]MBB3110754.1 phosphorylase kinase alpha/beta subunit [Paenibacillus phyllosphaerae]